VNLVEIQCSSNENKGVLYVVATPIGNYKDITERAVDILKTVDIVLAEDTRRTKPLLQRIGAGKPKIIAFHDHNEEQVLTKFIEELLGGKSVALVSDAGTPLISDPGYVLVAAAHDRGITVTPVPGVCAAIAALSVSGMPTDKFFFIGFLPPKTQQRRKALSALKAQQGTLVLYESTHRIIACLKDCLLELGDRKAVMARELTKVYETVRLSSLQGLIEYVESDVNQQKGEFVILIEGEKNYIEAGSEKDVDRYLHIMMKELSLKQAVGLTSEMLGVKKNIVYERALQLKDELK